MPRASSTGSRGDFKACPEGVIQGILVDIIDLGAITTNFAGEEKTRNMVNLVWQVDERRDDGKRFHIYQRLGLSLHVKANLRKIADTLRGRKMTDEEAEEGIELDDLKGSQALLTLVQNESNGKIYTNVEGVAPLMKGMTKLEQEPYERREKDAKKAQADDVPF